jgi:hypothetical protein
MMKNNRLTDKQKRALKRSKQLSRAVFDVPAGRRVEKNRKSKLERIRREEAGAW